MKAKEVNECTKDSPACDDTKCQVCCSHEEWNEYNECKECGKVDPRI